MLASIAVGATPNYTFIAPGFQMERPRIPVLEGNPSTLSFEDHKWLHSCFSVCHLHVLVLTPYSFVSSVCVCKYGPDTSSIFFHERSGKVIVLRYVVHLTFRDITAKALYSLHLVIWSFLTSGIVG